MKVLSAVVLSLSLIGSSLACTGYVPKNKLRIPVGVKNGGGLTQAQFNNVIDKVEAIYAPLISNLGGKLKVNRNWGNPEVNAYATRKASIYEVDMFGGFARSQPMTEDAFTTVLCHEIGHHLGGAPKGKRNGSVTWASNEGQADYFAATKCLRKVFMHDRNDEIVKKLNAPKILVDACERSWKNRDDKNICIRSGVASFIVSSMFANLQGNVVGFHTPDKKVVTQTFDAHPEFQCRLDTQFQGALCERSFNEDFSDTDEVQGSCHKKLGDKIGLRPLCWFKPSV
jgi:hypothetical protein